MSATHNPPDPPLHTFKFTEPDIRVVDEEYSEIQRAILPVVGFANGEAEPFATAFFISARLSMALTAWHVIDEFIEDNRAGLDSGECQLAVMYETSEPLGDGRLLGGPVPVWRVTHVPDTDLAILQLYEVRSGSTLVTPTRMEISFQVPVPGEWCYGFGYPHIKGGPVTAGTTSDTLDFERTLNVTAGIVSDVFPAGRGVGGRLPPTCPVFLCDAPGPSGVSGGPFRTDSTGWCGLLSTSYDPYDDDDPWATFVSLFTPLLACPIRYHDGPEDEIEATMHELTVAGFFGVQGALPAAPPPVRVEPLTFPPPERW